MREECKMSHRLRRDAASGRLLFCLLVSVLAATLGASAEDKPLNDDWGAFYLQGQRIGYLHTVIVEKKTAAGTLYETATDQVMSLGRGSVTMKISVSDRITEDADGRLVSFVRTMEQGPIRQVIRGEVEGETLAVTTEGMGPAQTVPAPAGLCPWALAQAIREKGYKPGTTYTLPIFVPAAPMQECTATVKVGEKEKKEVFEVAKWLHRVAVEVSILPGLTRVMWMDDSGEVWLERTAVGIYIFEVRKVSKEAALQPLEKVEIMLTSAVKPDKPIPAPRELERLQLLLTPTGESAVKLKLPSDAYQTVTEQERGLLVSIRRAHGRPDKSYRLPYKDKEWADLLKETMWVEAGDPLVVQMAKEAVGDETDALEAARKIEAYVGVVIEEKNLSMGFATAAETARQRAGDCSEHAVLVAALARAAGMPGRVVCGMAYGALPLDETERRFFYHMWAEVYVGEWLPLDAALGSHDATHIAMVRSGLERPGDMVEITGPILPFLGSLEIKVVKPAAEGAER